MTDQQADPWAKVELVHICHDYDAFFYEVDAVDAARAADAAQIATLTAERDLLKRGVATVTFGDADATIAKLVAERDGQYDQAVEATQRALLAEQALTDTLTDTGTTGHRAALVAYYEGRRASAQQEADDAALMARTVRVLTDAEVIDEYQRMLGRR